MGIPFSATLLGILMAHEMGHFIFSVRNGVYATLPFFIPFPSPFGTMGAFIQIKSPFRSRAALFDIGIAGPIAGFLIAVPMAAIGLALSHPLPANLDPTSTQLGQPVIFELLFWMMKQFGNGSLSQLPLTLVFLHPVALAAWVGMLATALNLIPGGQLDGGHLVYAIRPQAHLNVTRMMMILLVPLAIFYWSGWLIWVLALHLTRRHPPVPYWPDLDPRRRFWALVAVLIFILTFIPQPVPNMSLIDTVRQLLHSQ
jgi:membrane-associated protease RseP (regulator of RpoE activity)